MKFSIIVPVYNVEKYIADCLNSILEQTYDDFELIVVNDGSPDNSQKVIDKFVKKDKRVKSFIKENGGLSDARNYGVEKATGEYLLFIDSDDTVNKYLLEELSNEINKCKKVDLVKYGINKIIDDNIIEDENPVFRNISGGDAFKRLINNSWFVTAVSCTYRREFWLKNNFKYSVGKYHEDFGLTPYVYMKAKKVSSINYNGYNYYFRENSITTDTDIKKVIKRNEDTLYHFDHLMELVLNDQDIDKEDKKFFNSFMSNAIINRCNGLKDNKDILNSYIKEIKSRRVGKYLLSNNILRLLKKMLFNICPKVYIKYIVK